MEFENVVRGIAPTVATALLGPLGGIAANIVAGVIFGDDDAAKAAATPASVMNAIATSQDPDLIAKLRQADLDLKKFEADNQFRFADLDEKSVEDARRTRLAALVVGDHTADRLGRLVIWSFLCVAGIVFLGCGFLLGGFLRIDNQDPEVMVAVSGLIGSLVGYFSANAQQVVGFYFGSSSGSKEKSDQLASTTTTALSAIMKQNQVAFSAEPGGRMMAASGQAAQDLTDDANSGRETMFRSATAAPARPPVAPRAMPVSGGEAGGPETARATRGYRNRNPGNIVWTPANKWQGQTGKEGGANGRFAVFENHEYGIRALCALLVSYQDKYDLRTVRGIIGRWAPESDHNDTAAYVSAVAAACAVDPDATIDLHRYDTLRPLAAAIIQHECGGLTYREDVMAEALRLAGLVAAAA